MTDSSEKHFDVVIVGAGMAGSLLALSLLKKNQHLDILLLDENVERKKKSADEIGTNQPHNIHHNPSFDARCLALNAGSIDILQQLSLWEMIAPGAQSIDKIEVSDKGCFGALSLTPERPLSAFGAVVELQHVGEVLADALSAYPTLNTLHNVKLINIKQSLQSVACELNNGDVIHAKLCVGADGSTSKTREIANIPSVKKDYRCSAVICNVRCSREHNSIAYERFTESGPVALLPLSNNRYSVVYCVKNSELEAMQNLSDEDFLLKLQQHFGFRAGIFKVTGKRHSYPLYLLTTSRPIAHRIVCVGNAAHNLHPVAGQGFNLGLRDVFVLAQVIASTAAKSIGTFSMLEKYWQCREKDHNNTILMTDSLVRIFSNPYYALRIPRNIGLSAMSFFPFLAQPMIKQAKGQFDLFIRENE